MKKKIIYLFIVFTIGLSATIINARPFGKWHLRGSHGGCGIGTIHHQLKELNLSKEQKAEIAIILKSVRSNSTLLVDDLIKSQKNIVNTINDVNYNEIAIREASANQASIKEEFTVLVGQVFHDIRDVLTDEQKTKLKSFPAECEEILDDRIDFARLKIDKWIKRYDTSGN